MPEVTQPTVAASIVFSAVLATPLEPAVICPVAQLEPQVVNIAILVDGYTERLFEPSVSGFTQWVTAGDAQLNTVFDRLHDKIRDLSGLSDGWDGRGAPAPSATAADMAQKVLVIASRFLAPPDRIVPDADGGLAVYWMRHERQDQSHRFLASIVIDNDGAIAATTKDRETGAFDAWDVADDNLSATVRRLNQYVSSGGA